MCPLLKLLGGGDPSQERNDVMEVATSSISSLARLPWESKVATTSGENFDKATSERFQRRYRMGGTPYLLWSAVACLYDEE
ncbi:unnamed protein product [Urochloa humidicola]